MSGNTPTSMKILMEGWRSFVESPKVLSEKYSDQGITVPEPALEPLASPREIPPDLKAPIDPKKSAIIGSLRGTGQKSKLDKAGNIKRKPLPFGLLVNGEHLGEDPRWILGANMQGNKKKNHYGTNELIKVIKKGIEYVHLTSQEEYDRLWLAYILGDTSGTVTNEDQIYIDFLKKENIIPKVTGPLLIEDLGLGPYHADIYGNTYHGGRKVRGHGSHQTGQDGDLGFYMMPGYEMVKGFRVASPSRGITKGFLERKDLEKITTTQPDHTKDKRDKSMDQSHSILTGLKDILGTFDPIRTWKLISGMAGTGLVDITIIDKSLHPSLRSASKLCEEYNVYSEARLRGKVANHKNHIHIRVNAPDSIKRGKPLAKKLRQDFMKKSNTKDWLKDFSKRSKSGLTSKLYPERDPYEDLVNSLFRRQ